MKVLITGANGFIGKNLQLCLREREDIEVVPFTRDNNISELPTYLRGVDVVFHLAGINRPKNQQEFVSGNIGLTQGLCNAVQNVDRQIHIVYTSSTQAQLDNPYGRSKKKAEEILRRLSCHSNSSVHLFRLPHVFGKLGKPNYNSVVATFCHNIARGLPVRVNDPHAVLTMVYIDDLIGRFMRLMDGEYSELDGEGYEIIAPLYNLTVRELVRHINEFHEKRENLSIECVGSGLMKALYATYVSYLPLEDISYDVPCYADDRGMFVEMIKTPNCGQFSLFTVKAGFTRGGHYHHTKTEKFLVVQGEARFRFRNVQTGQIHEVMTSGRNPQVVESVPGWSHDITNTGDLDLIVMLWTNEVFDRLRPDTYAYPF